MVPNLFEPLKFYCTYCAFLKVFSSSYGKVKDSECNQQQLSKHFIACNALTKFSNIHILIIHIFCIVQILQFRINLGQVVQSIVSITKS